MSKLRTAIIGCGDFANRHAANMAAMQDIFDLTAFCDVYPVRAEAFAKKYTRGEAQVYSDHHQLFEREKLDLVAVCLPPYGHSDEVALASERGIHIFIEKPIALTSAAAWEMVVQAEKAGIKTQVGFMFRFGAAIDAFRHMVELGETGALGLMSARYFCNSLHSSWWRMRDKSGGQLVEQVIHMVDLMRYLMGKPTTVFSLQNNLFHRDLPDYTVEDVSGTVVSFDGGGIGVLYATNGAIPGKWINDYRLVSRNVTAEFADANHAAFTFTAKPYSQTQTIASDQDYYTLELLDLVHAIKTGGSTRTPMREGALSLDLALAATRSAESGQPVHLR